MVGHVSLHARSRLCWSTHDEKEAFQVEVMHLFRILIIKKGSEVQQQWLMDTSMACYLSISLMLIQQVVKGKSWLIYA